MAEKITKSLEDCPLQYSLLYQADRLIQVFESTVFAHVRLHFLDMSNPKLYSMLQSIFGLLMVLPQTKAYSMCIKRLSNLSNVYYLVNGN